MPLKRGAGISRHCGMPWSRWYRDTAWCSTAGTFRGILWASKRGPWYATTPLLWPGWQLTWLPSSQKIRVQKRLPLWRGGLPGSTCHSFFHLQPIMAKILTVIIQRVLRGLIKLSYIYYKILHKKTTNTLTFSKLWYKINSQLWKNKEKGNF